MKVLLMFLGLLLQSNSFCQQAYERDSLGRLKGQTPEFKINHTNHNQFYQDAKELINFDDRDSIFKAFRLLKHLHYFDSSIYSNKILQQLFSQIEKKSYDYYHDNLLGEWVFEWSGSNWGTSETSASKKEKIIFTESKALFYTNDSLNRQTSYKIRNDFKGYLSKEIFFLLYLEDTKAAWEINFQNKGADYVAKLKFSEEHVGLFINENYHCICGCHERIYLKKKPLYITHSTKL